MRKFAFTLPFSGPSVERPKSLYDPPESSDVQEQGGHHGKGQSDPLPFIRKIFTHGSAQQMGTEPLGPGKPFSFIAQEESESQDLQEFCPNSRHKNVTQASRDAGRVPGFCRESLSVQETGPPCVSLLGSGKRRAPLPALAAPRGYAPECQASTDGERTPSCSEGNYSLAAAGLKCGVIQGERCYAPAFTKELEREARESQDADVEMDSTINGGALFHEKQQPVDYEYREGREYELCELLNQGSYGDVYKVKDKTTKFICAAKKILLSKFSSEEVGTWSALTSPRVVELFGTVREGPYIILFMDLKAGSLGQLLEQRGRLPEGWALHYTHQVLQALEHLHRRRVAHMDIKVDNVLLSEDGKDIFLCDFGLSERLDAKGMSLYASQAPKGTETHMAPEVVQGEGVGAKADVWSTCCMLLHMLNGCQPWICYFSRPLYLKIVDEPPPLREIPPDCNPYTADVIKAGLQKKPGDRASAKQLRETVGKALEDFGELCSPVRGGVYQPPLRRPEKSDSAQSSLPTTSSHTPMSSHSELQWMSSEEKWREGERQMNKSVTRGDEEEAQKNSRGKNHACQNPSPAGRKSIQSQSPRRQNLSVYYHDSEQELHKLKTELYLCSLSQPHSAEQQEQMLSGLSSDCPSSKEPWEERDSGRWSLVPGDDFSSDVLSYNSQSDGQVLSLDLLVSTQRSTPSVIVGA